MTSQVGVNPGVPSPMETSLSSPVTAAAPESTTTDNGVAASLRTSGDGADVIDSPHQKPLADMSEVEKALIRRSYVIEVTTHG